MGSRAPLVAVLTCHLTCWGLIIVPLSQVLMITRPGRNMLCMLSQGRWMDGHAPVTPSRKGGSTTMAASPTWNITDSGFLKINFWYDLYRQMIPNNVSSEWRKKLFTYCCSNSVELSDEKKERWTIITQRNSLLFFQVRRCRGIQKVLQRSLL